MLSIEAALEKLLPPERHAARFHSSRHALQRVRRAARGSGRFCAWNRRGCLQPDLAGAVQVGCALEFIHTYSLIHDDLPALDNDDLRRGKPTNHKVFGEAMAILAGDALAHAGVSNSCGCAHCAEARVRVIAEIGAAAGTVNGMVGGQVADVEAGGNPVDAAMLEYIHRSKTAALIRGSIVAGAIAGGAAPEDVERLRAFGENIGWAFQVVDDILDVEESSAALGKTAGKDQAQQKATYPALYGLEKSRAIAAELESTALARTGAVRRAMPRGCANSRRFWSRGAREPSVRCRMNRRTASYLRHGRESQPANRALTC